MLLVDYYFWKFSRGATLLTITLTLYRLLLLILTGVLMIFDKGANKNLRKITRGAKIFFEKNKKFSKSVVRTILKALL